MVQSFEHELLMSTVMHERSCVFLNWQRKMRNIFCHFYFLSKVCNLGIFSSHKLKRAIVLQVREDTQKSYLF